MTEHSETLIWVERPVMDVRAGDMVRLPSQEGTERRVLAAKLSGEWHVHPATQESRNPVSADWRQMDITFMGEAQAHHFEDLEMPVEIQVYPSEVAAIEMLGGWSERQ